MIRLRGRRTFDAGYYLHDRGRELEHLEISQQAPIGGGSSNWDVQYRIDRRSLELLAGAQPLRAVRPLADPKRHILVLEVLAVPPKVVSLYALLTPPEVGRPVVEAHHRALEGALRYLERHGVATNHRNEPANRVAELAGVRFTHGVSRSSDPHLHSHLVLANLGRSVEGRFGALDSRGLRAHLATASALYDAEILGACSRLGLDLEIEPIVVSTFSSRAAEARAHRAAGTPFGFKSGKAAGEDRRELLLEWERRAVSFGVDLERFRSASIEVRPMPRRLDEEVFTRQLLGDDRLVTRRKVVEAWAWASSGQAADEVERNVDAVAGPSASIFEQPLVPRDVVASSKAVRTLGPRPLELEHLKRWLERAVELDHASSTRQERERSSRDRSLDRRLDHGFER